MLTCGIGIGRGGFAVKYFVADGIAMELHAGGAPHLISFGAGMHVQPKSSRAYFVLGYSRIIGYSLIHSDTLIMINGDTVSSRSSILTGLSAGIGLNIAQMKSKGRVDRTYIHGAAGPMYILNSKSHYYTNKGKSSTNLNSNHRYWHAFLDGGASFYFEPKN